MKRPESPAQIRRRASIAFRRRVRSGLSDMGQARRAADETPLSAAEVQFGLERGLIQNNHRGA